MNDFSGSRESQGGNLENDAIQQMILQAMAAAVNDRPTLAPGPTASAPNSGTDASTEQPSYGERIGRKTSVAPAQAAQPSPSEAATPRPASQIAVKVAPPDPSSIPPGATGVLRPVAPDSTGSFGEKIGAKTSVVPQAASSALTAPSSTSPVSLNPMSVLSTTPPAIATDKLGGTGSSSMRPVLQAPVGAQNPQLVDLLKQQAEAGKPIDRNAVDPKTGKPMYKMGWGQRLLGTASNFLTGFGGGKGPITYVGPGATNSRYDIAEATREERLKGLGRDIAGQEKLDTENLNKEKLAQREAYEQALGASRGETAEARMKTGEAQEKNAETRRLLEVSEEQLNEARAGKAETPGNEFAGWYDSFKRDNKRSPTAKEILDHDIQLKKAGKEGRQPSDLEMWHGAFVRDNGREPTAEEIAGRRTNRSIELDKVEKDRDAALQKAEDKAEKRIKELKIFDPANPGPIEKRKQAIYADLEKDKAQAVANFQERVAQVTKTSPPATSANTPAKAPPKPTTPPPAGKLWVYDKKTGKRGLIPASQLSIATKSANAQYGTW